ncbi:type IV pilin protein [Kineococcus rhizosphaerae]|uniref:Prepilin-type N-terminal cleavage/methylation domain-containing protein n=1 Tax=Kineococcus rhizosphaerae TaxID=559628 RepID=A0A2T0R9R9_9ACTN|nr:prepilin-type N-terminal cleavage/methylation domain-containing protein [Kineococcus rhizosphaerae]PRY17906.1 prepilin-type N-terminal cleavage/methylation domain-containing protein [Kineococcus rhizosphaerae]
MLARIRKSIEDKDQGFTLIELLVVMIIIGILAAIAIPVFLNQRKKAVDSSLKADVKTIATAEETNFTDNSAYVATTGAAGADLTIGDTVKVSPNNAFTITLNTAGTAYCIVGTNTKASRPLVYVSSAGGQQPTSVTVCPTTF